MPFLVPTVAQDVLALQNAFLCIYILGWAALKTYNSIKWAIQSTYKHIGATWLTIARSPKPTKSIRSEAKHCERPTSLTHFIELRLQWRLEIHIEIKVIYLDLSNGDGLHWIRPTERIFVQYSDQKKTVCSMRQPTKHDCLFHLPFFCVFFCVNWTSQA